MVFFSEGGVNWLAILTRAAILAVKLFGIYYLLIVRCGREERLVTSGMLPLTTIVHGGAD